MALTGRKQLGEILIQVGLITEEHLAEALRQQQALGGKLGSRLIRMGHVREADILRCLSDQLRLSYVDFREIEIPQSALDSVSIEIARKFSVIPIALQRRRVVLAMSDPTQLEMIKEIEFQIGAGVLPVIAADWSITRAIDHYYGSHGGAAGSTEAVPDDKVVAEIAGPANPESEVLQEVDTLGLVRLLISVLEQKGNIGHKDFAEALQQMGYRPQVAC
jgi:type IV pilus assembly protein PilB